jgi:hypothetical protein
VMNPVGSRRPNLDTDEALRLLTHRGVLVKVQARPLAVWALSDAARAEMAGEA